MKKLTLSLLILCSVIVFYLQSFCQKNPISKGTVDFNKVVFINEKKGWILAPMGALLTTNDGGNTWKYQIIDNRSTTLLDFQMVNQKLGFIVGGNSSIYKTSDGGLSWNRIIENNSYDMFHSSTARDFHSVSFLNEKIGFIVGNEGVVLKSTDGGENWIAKRIERIKWLSSVRFVNENRGIAVGYASNEEYYDSGKERLTNYACVVETENAGNTWVPYALPEYPPVHTYPNFPPSFTKIYFLNGKTGFLLGNMKCLYKTIDSGKSWQLCSTNEKEILRDAYFIDETVGYVVGNSGTILKTSDGGHSWIKINSGTSKNLNSVFFVGVNKGFVVGEGGVILKTNDGGRSWVLEEWGALYEKQMWLHK